MGLLDKMKAGAEQAVSSGQRQAQILQTKRELGQAYDQLGKTAYGLVQRGDISHADLAAGVDRITELQSRLAAASAGVGTADATAADATAADATAADAGVANAGAGDEADIVE
jgi:hypothetical protein